ncbi:MAG: serine acetyltransferase [Proteobacteria bacterium]|nr:serine acetyltransferase [Pseudomonadota bacterium]
MSNILETKPIEACQLETEKVSRFRDQLPEKIEKIVANCYDKTCHNHIDYDPLPSRESVIRIIEKMREILFPGYFSEERVDPANLKYSIGQSVSLVYDMLSVQITDSIRYECLRYNKECSQCSDQGHQFTLYLLDGIPEIRRQLSTDVEATYTGDPAARSYDEIIFSYPGVFATAVYRVANRLFELGVPLLPRMMTEYAHSITGIDIHPGAEIGDGFVIDHGTGVVIGETTIIGNNVRIYQGVTIGALSLPKEAGEKFRGKKRHPTIEDNVIVYSGATILGGDTVIGARSVIGGNVWLTKSIPPDTRVLIEEPRLVYK